VNRRQFLKNSAVAGAGIAVAGWAGWPDPASAAAACLWGARIDPSGTETTEQATLNLESKIGRKFAIARQYAAWDRDLPDGYDTWAAQGGRMPYIAWQATKISGAAVTWSSIANGVWDSRIKSQAQALKTWGKPAYFCFHHEPENDGKNGDATQFKAAWAHVKNIFGSVGATNLKWVAAFMASTYNGGHGGIDTWMPSGSDILFGVDGYNRGACDPKPGWRSFDQIFQPAHAYAVNKGHGLFIGEYGCVEDTACGNTSGSGSRKAQWFTDASTTIKSWPELKAIVYSNTEWVFNGVDVNYRVTTSAKSLSAYKTVGLDGYFQ
jgi:hypothetical protein